MSMMRATPILMLLLTCLPAQAQDTPQSLRQAFLQQVDRRLDLPPAEQEYYAGLLASELQQAGLLALPPQYLLLVDRSPLVQAMLLYLVADGEAARYIGASPVSTGRRGGLEYFETPTGVFDHNIERFDFRSEGTMNKLGIRGYGEKGMRIYDFGWVRARRTWKKGEGQMRLLIHSTDPELLEPRLGTVQSKGCIRIPASLNRFIDHHGLLDAEYERAMASGQRVWVLRTDRKRSRWPGRYLVVVDSGRDLRPDWSPAPEFTPIFLTRPLAASSAEAASAP